MSTVSQLSPELQQALAPLGRHGLQANVPLAPFTSFHIGGPARWLLTVQRQSDLLAALYLLHRHQIPYFILGGGSNVLISDHGLDCVVILNQCRDILWPEGEHTIVTAAAGAPLAGLARASLQRGLTGLSWAVSVPGTIGGAVVGNAGAHGGCMADHVRYLTLWQEGRIRHAPVEELQYSYRSSAIKRAYNDAVVLSATLQLERGDVALAQEQAQSYLAHRRRTQPTDKSAGSIFKNPPHAAAGRLLDEAGLKGVQAGGAAVSEQHANFIVNQGDASANDVLALMQIMQRRVRRRFGVQLQPEIQFVGEWPDPQPATLFTLPWDRAPQTPPKLRVAVLFGGRSGEHEVSLQSVQSVLKAIDRRRYEVIPMGIDHDGRWLMQEDALDQLLAGHKAPASAPAWPSPEDLQDIDVVLPILHGTYGEDGTLQGFLDLAGVPYAGCGVLASALAMDKAVSKLAFAAAGLPQAPWLVLLRRHWEEDPAQQLARIERELPYPLFVKPANLGSSVGISKAHDRRELQKAIAFAARFDRKLVIEQAVPHAREIEISVLGNDQPLVSLPGEIVPGNEFYDYAAKYLNGTSQERIPAPISLEQQLQVQSMAVQAFRAIDGSGMARIDFLLNDATGEIMINEINTIPGFTQISMYPKLWAASGLSFPQLIDRLLVLALERHATQLRNQTRFEPAS